MFLKGDLGSISRHSLFHRHQQCLYRTVQKRGVEMEEVQGHKALACDLESGLESSSGELVLTEGKKMTKAPLPSTF